MPGFNYHEYLGAKDVRATASAIARNQIEINANWLGADFLLELFNEASLYLDAYGTRMPVYAVHAAFKIVAEFKTPIPIDTMQKVASIGDNSLRYIRGLINRVIGVVETGLDYVSEVKATLDFIADKVILFADVGKNIITMVEDGKAFSALFDKYYLEAMDAIRFIPNLDQLIEHLEEFDHVANVLLDGDFEEVLSMSKPLQEFQETLEGYQEEVDNAFDHIADMMEISDQLTKLQNVTDKASNIAGLVGNIGKAVKQLPLKTFW